MCEKRKKSCCAIILLIIQDFIFTALSVAGVIALAANLKGIVDSTIVQIFIISWVFLTLIVCIICHTVLVRSALSSNSNCDNAENLKETYEKIFEKADSKETAESTDVCHKNQLRVIVKCTAKVESNK